MPPKRPVYVVGAATNHLPEMRKAPKLSFAESDLDHFLMHMCERFPGASIWDFSGKDATTDTILDALRRAADEADVGEDALIVFYFSGHGTLLRDKAYELGVGYVPCLLTYDAVEKKEDIHGGLPDLPFILHLLVRVLLILLQIFCLGSVLEALPFAVGLDVSGRLVEVFFRDVGVPDQETHLLPFPNCSLKDTQSICYFLRGQHSPLSQALVSVLDALSASDQRDPHACEGQAGSSAQALFI